MLRTLILFITLILAISTGLAQETLTSKLDWYKSFFTTKGILSAEEESRLNQKLEEVLEINDKGSEAHIRKQIGLLQLTRVYNYEKALQYFLAALKIEESLHLRRDLIISYVAMARVFEEVGDYYKSIELLETALQVNENYKDKNILVYISNELGKNYAALGKIEVAFEHYELVLRIPELERTDKAEALFNIGHLFTLKNDYNKALEKHKAALKLWRELNDRFHEAQSLNDVGELYHSMKNEAKALDNFTVALKIRNEIKDTRGLAQSYNNLGVFFYLQKDYNKAIEHLQQGFESAQAAQWAEQSALSREYLSFCWKDVGNFEKALEHREANSQLIEFIHLEKEGRHLLELQNRYVLNSMESEITELEITQREKEEKLADKEKLQNFLFALIGFGLIIVLLTLYSYMVKRRSNTSLKAAHHKLNQQNLELQNLNATKDKFFSIISHDLKGPLNSFTAFSKMLIEHTESLTKDEIQMLAKEIDKNLKNLYALLENLLEWSRSQTGNIEFKPEPFDLHLLLQQNKELLSTQASNKKIDLIYQFAGPLPVRAHKHSVNTVIRNLISNAIKFTPEGGTITLEAVSKQGKLRVSVADTGVGMTQDVIEKLFRIDTKYSTTGTANEKGTGLGLILCKDFIEKNGGTIGVESTPGQGSIFFFTLPLSENLIKSPDQKPILEKELIR